MIVRLLLLIICFLGFGMSSFAVTAGGNKTIEQKVVEFNNGAKITIYHPKESVGVGIVMCPGGGYDHLAVTHEGHDMAAWMNGLGITYAVLEYRLPHGRSLVPLTDAEEAMRIMRKNMEEAGEKNFKVGIMGGSAGGNLAATLATMHRTADSRPDFQILLYPVISLEKSITNSGTRKQLIGWDADQKTTDAFSPDKHVTKDTPQAFIALSDDDTAVIPENSLRYYTALHAKGVSASLHIYPIGGHGWGFKDSFQFKRQWTGELEKWLLSQVIAKNESTATSWSHRYQWNQHFLHRNAAMLERVFVV